MSITLATTASDAAIVSFTIYLAIVFLLAWFANRAQEGKSFVGEYFLGSRNIGLWGFALTYAATAASGGSFMGFPSLIYSHGWVLAWWIAGYCVVPLVALGLLAKRINQVSRLAGAITVPELLRKRFSSGAVGIVAILMLILFMFIFLMAQFKAGAEIMAVLLADVEPYQQAARFIDSIIADWWWIGESGDYVLCLVFFAVAVIVYTSYGGYKAVVWTDVMQGIVMLIGVLIMLVLALQQVGGLSNATQQLAKMTPPEFGQAVIQPTDDSAADLAKGTWLRTSTGGLARMDESFVAESDADSTRVLFLTNDEGAEARVADQVNSSFVAVEVDGTREAPAYGRDRPGVYVSAPGPDRKKSQGFLSVALALSFFMFWNFSGAGQPSYMVRQMSFRDTRILRRSIMMVAVFFGLIYFPLVVIFTSARVLLPGMEIHSDRIMPEMAAHLTTSAGVPWVAGLLFAAPFAAVMSSVDSFLLLVSSGVVRDIYQQSINPKASDRTLKRLSYTTTLLVGMLAMLAMLNPPNYLQTLIVFASSGLGATFLAPVAFGLFWKRMTAGGAVGGMLAGAMTVGALYLTWYAMEGELGPYNLLGLDPFIWGSVISTGAVVGISLCSEPPDEDLIQRYFGRE